MCPIDHHKVIVVSVIIQVQIELRLEVTLCLYLVLRIVRKLNVLTQGVVGEPQQIQKFMHFFFRFAVEVQSEVASEE